MNMKADYLSMTMTGKYIHYDNNKVEIIDRL